MILSERDREEKKTKKESTFYNDERNNIFERIILFALTSDSIQLKNDKSLMAVQQKNLETYYWQSSHSFLEPCCQMMFTTLL